MVTLRHAPTYTRSGPILEPYQVILRPLITEKATHLSERHNAYTFEVNPLATKTEIKEAVRASSSTSRSPMSALRITSGQASSPPAPKMGRHAKLEKSDRCACNDDYRIDFY